MKRSFSLIAISSLLIAQACGSGAAQPASPASNPQQPAASSSAESDRRPSTPEERAWAVRVTHQLEADPLSAELAPEREKLLAWLINVPDLTVEVCVNMIIPGAKKDDPVAAILAVQQMFSQGAFLIEHGGDPNAPAAHLAGVEGVLRAYAAIVSAKSEAKNAKFDELIELKAKGKLQDYVASAVKNCDKH